MSKYTTEIKFICESLYPLEEWSDDNPSVNKIIDKVHSKIFDFEYPIFDEDYRKPLQIKILKHFYTREIGEETFGLWKLRLDTRLNEIMPYYNQLYESSLIKYNPLYNIDLYREGENTDKVEHEGEGSSIGSGTDNTVNNGNSRTDTADNNSRWNLYSDTPQGGINGIAYAEDEPAVGTNAYLTNATHITDNGNSNSSTSYSDNANKTTTNNVNTTEDYTDNIMKKINEHTYGFNMKNPALAIKEFRETFLNIDLMIIKDLEDLFLNIW